MQLKTVSRGTCLSLMLVRLKLTPSLQSVTASMMPACKPKGMCRQQHRARWLGRSVAAPGQRAAVVWLPQQGSPAAPLPSRLAAGACWLRQCPPSHGAPRASISANGAAAAWERRGSQQPRAYQRGATGADVDPCPVRMANAPHNVCSVPAKRTILLALSM